MVKRAYVETDYVGFYLGKMLSTSKQYIYYDEKADQYWYNNHSKWTKLYLIPNQGRIIEGAVVSYVEKDVYDVLVLGKEAK